MNFEQKRAIDIVLEGHNLLLLGSAGTGKSFVIKDIARRLKLNGKNVQITCSTGIACSVFDDACTIHRFTGISDGRYGPDGIIDVVKNSSQYEYVIENIKKIDTLIVDECSMISQQVFDSINNVCKIKNPSCQFGGIQIIFSGDFLQLPPVASLAYGDEGKYCFESEKFREVFPHRVVLTEIIRQRDEQFLRVISEVFNGLVSPESETFICNLSRQLDVPVGQQSVKLFSKNELADNYNRKCVLDFPGDLFEFKSVDQGVAASLLEISAPHTLWLKVGCPVLLLRNLSDKLFNGLQGSVKEIPEDGSGPVVEFPSVSITLQIPKVKFTVYSPRLNINTAVREQYPLKLAFGLTIHKAQGMTLNRVEVDCRDIFRSGQLGVAMSRASTVAGLRVINYHPRYIIAPPQSVTDFMNEASQKFLDDFMCCRNSHSLPHGSQSEASVQEHSTSTAAESIEHNVDIEDIDTEIIDENLDDDFNVVIASILSDEAESIDFQIPDGFSIDHVMQNMIYKKEITEAHKCINKIIYEVDKHKLITFTKKLFLKFAEYVVQLTGKQTVSSGIPEKNIANFYRLVHEFSTSTEYRMSCLMLFDEENFSDHHMIICYNILEAVRLFYLKQKVDLLKISKSHFTKRCVTDASRARVRYVAGYCLASLRKKYTKLQKSHLFSTSKQGQETYTEAKWAVYILNVLKEDEHYLKVYTDEPTSLIDVERRQYVSRGLTNVTDSLFKFFVNLTERSLDLLVHENLMKFGKNIYNRCLEIIINESCLYEQFSNIVACSYSKQPVEEFDENGSVNSLMENMVLISSQVCSIYHELVEKYLMVLLSQFRKDIKSACKVEKTMAHRKQIKVSTQKQKSASNVSSDKSKEIAAQTFPQEPSSTVTSVSSCLPEEPQAGPSQEPQSGASIHVPDPEEGEDLCQSCFSNKDDDLIECDSCNGWFHRKCAGLKTAKMWKKFSKEGVSWFCKSCK